MKKILFFPLLRMPSGHHQVADTIADYFKTRNPNIICKKVDLLSSWNPWVESVVTKTYLEWIHHHPKSYAWVYEQMAHSTKSERTYKYYEFLFLKKMQKIINAENPDLIICTHGFPSYFLSRLKKLNQCQTPVINVYTDFFINDVWGREGIDYHFVPSQAVKDELIKRDGIFGNRIFITGIPIGEEFNQSLKPQKSNSSSKWNILVSGGSVGLGNISRLLQDRSSDQLVEYFVLCGSNRKLYQGIQQLGYENIHPLPYISSRERMNELYSQSDAIITKPGGVTISEAFKKRVPVFIHSALPGQEEINLKLLKKLRLVYEINNQQLLADQIIGCLEDESLMTQYNHSLTSYLSEIQAGEPNHIYNLINNLLESPVEHAFN